MIEDEVHELQREIHRLKIRIRTLEAYSDMPEHLKNRSNYVLDVEDY